MAGRPSGPAWDLVEQFNDGSEFNMEMAILKTQRSKSVLQRALAQMVQDGEVEAFNNARYRVYRVNLSSETVQGILATIFARRGPGRPPDPEPPGAAGGFVYEEHEPDFRSARVIDLGF